MYQIAEKFKSVQGEGAYAGTPMAFIRFVGCSVGKKICQHCDTDFEQSHAWRGGGEFTAVQLLDWVGDYERICLTGGEPFDWNIQDIVRATPATKTIHVETSGTKLFSSWRGQHNFYFCVSPKPGWIEECIDEADEVKVIVPGLGTEASLRNLAGYAGQGRTPRAWDGLVDLRWPDLEDALRWSVAGKVVYLQPRNGKFDVDQNNLRIVQDIVAANPSLRLSVQMHKILKVQ